MKRLATGRIRIIAGALRGSRIEVPDRPGLRPTSDRVRETLFNWLAPFIDGANALDLFAGTGALGIEALSRGAGRVEFVESERDLADALRATLLRLKQPGIVHHVAASQFLRAPHGPYALVFLDPPFASDCLGEVAQHLENGGFLAETAMIYVESARTCMPTLPSTWCLHRELLTSDVRAALYRRVASVR